MSALKLAIHGAAGRMGKRLVALGHADEELEIVAALDSAAHPDAGKDAGLVAGTAELRIPIGATIPETVELIIDFSVPDAALANLAVCRQRGIPLVFATTGLADGADSEIHAAAADIPIVWAPNMSLAVNLTLKLAAQAATALKNQSSGVDVEILERHHRYKEDAPSGTALKFGETIQSIMGQTQSAHGRGGRPGVRPNSEIGYHAIRVGDNPGEHTIVFGLLGETVELTVRATSRDAYALGALAAAKFLASQSPGLYSMLDVLGLE